MKNWSKKEKIIKSITDTLYQQEMQWNSWITLEEQIKYLKT